MRSCGVPGLGGRRKGLRRDPRGEVGGPAQLHLKRDGRGRSEARDEDRSVDGVELRRHGRAERERPVRRDRREVDGIEPLDEGIGRKPRGRHHEAEDARRRDVAGQIVFLAGAGRDGAQRLDMGPVAHAVRAAVRGVRKRVERRPGRQVFVAERERETRRAERHARGIGAGERFAGRDAEQRAVSRVDDVIPAVRLVGGDVVGVPSGAEEPGAAGAATAISETKVHVLPARGFGGVFAMGERIPTRMILEDGGPVHDIVAVVVDELVEVVCDAGAHVHLSGIAPRVVAAPGAGSAATPATGRADRLFRRGREGLRKARLQATAQAPYTCRGSSR